MSGSAAETYAKSHGITFVALDDSTNQDSSDSNIPEQPVSEPKTSVNHSISEPKATENQVSSGTNATNQSISGSKATKITKLKKAKKGFTIKWKKISGINGYQIEYARNKQFTKGKKTATVKKARITSKKIKKLKSKKKYYVRIRTYKTVSGKKQYSAWSKIKTVKTK